jgi:hypothetical protein
LANGFEAVIGNGCQERSNHPFSHSYIAGKALQCIQGGAVNMERYKQFNEASRSSLGVGLGDLVDVVAWGIVPCVSKIDTLGGGAWGGVGGGVVLLVTTAD